MRNSPKKIVTLIILVIVTFTAGTIFKFMNNHGDTLQAEYKPYSYTIRFPKSMKGYINDPTHEHGDYVYYELKGVYFKDLASGNLQYLNGVDDNIIDNPFHTLSKIFTYYKDGNLEKSLDLYVDKTKNEMKTNFRDARIRQRYVEIISKIQSMSVLFSFEYNDGVYVLTHVTKSSNAEKGNPVLPYFLKKVGSRWLIEGIMMDKPLITNIDSFFENSEEHKTINKLIWNK